MTPSRLDERERVLRRHAVQRSGPPGGRTVVLLQSAAQAEFLRDLGVLGQGFAVGRPVPAQEVVPWLTPAAWLAAPAPWHLVEEEPAAGRG